MKLDPILAEIRQTRDAMALKYDGDIGAMIADLNQRHKVSADAIYSQPPKRLVPPVTVTPTAIPAAPLP